jgi:drug/metabolite transporter (DMT)-like permease
VPHVLGALIAFAGAGVIVLGRVDAGDGSMAGMALAFLCALTWAGYSVLSRKLGAVPTESVTVFCLLTAALSLAAHLVWEETVWPAGPLGWAALLALGLGPVGVAFFTWDIGMKRGNIQLLGVASYAAPLLSTLALITAGLAKPTWNVALAALLIAGGAALAARASAK